MAILYSECLKYLNDFNYAQNDSNQFDEMLRSKRLPMDNNHSIMRSHEQMTDETISLNDGLHKRTKQPTDQFYSIRSHIQHTALSPQPRQNCLFNLVVFCFLLTCLLLDFVVICSQPNNTNHVVLRDEYHSICL